MTLSKSENPEPAEMLEGFDRGHELLHGLLKECSDVISVRLFVWAVPVCQEVWTLTSQDWLKPEHLRSIAFHAV